MVNFQLQAGRMLLSIHKYRLKIMSVNRPNYGPIGIRSVSVVSMSSIPISGSTDADGPEGKPTSYAWSQVAGTSIPDFAGREAPSLKVGQLDLEMWGSELN